MPHQLESLIVQLKRDKPHWGARKIRELLIRRLVGDVRVPAKSTIHAVLDRHGWAVDLADVGRRKHTQHLDRTITKPGAMDILEDRHDLFDPG